MEKLQHPLRDTPYRLFILGAGFSKPAGLPLSIELLEYIRRNVKYCHQSYGWDGPLEEEIREWKNLYPDEEENLEQVLAYSHRKHYLRLDGPERYFSDGSRTIVAMRENVQNILMSHTPEITPSLYLKFSGRLIPLDTILTFNYDTLLEQSLDDLNKPYSHTPEWWLKREELGEPLTWRYVDILKLHGSIDWYDKKYYDETRAWLRKNGGGVPDECPLFGPNPTVPISSLSRGRTDEIYGQNILSRVYRVPDHKKYYPVYKNMRSRVVPFILPLSYDKLFGHEPVLDFWENLHRIQHDFSSISIIGYSMPKHDSYAYEALGHICVEYQKREQNKWERTRIPIQVITLADSDTKALENFPFLNPTKTRVWSKGFSEESLKWLDWEYDD